MSLSSHDTVLHATPPFGGLPASDVESLYLAAVLQSALPGRWAIKSGEWATNGSRLPYITHLDNLIRTRHLSSLPGWADPDGPLSEEERAEAVSWRAYIEGTLTDLVNHTLYSLPPNYPDLAHAQLDGLRFPENHYIPQRLRGVVKARLSHVGLWGVGGLHDGDAADEDRKRLDEAFVVGPAGTTAPRAWTGWRSGRETEKRRRKWGEGELARRARGVLDPLARRLAGREYWFGASPTTPDLLLFAHLSLLLTPTFPNPLLPDLIRSTYPSLSAHHDRVRSALFGGARIHADGSSDASASAYAVIHRITLPPSPTLWESLSDTVSSWWADTTTGNGSGSASAGDKPRKKTAKEKEFERGRWAWFAAAGVGMVVYLLASGLVRVEYAGEGDDEEEGEENEDGDEDEDEEEDEDEDEDLGPLTGLVEEEDDE